MIQKTAPHLQTHLQTADYRPQTADYKLQTHLQTADYKLQIRKRKPGTPRIPRRGGAGSTVAEAPRVVAEIEEIGEEVSAPESSVASTSGTSSVASAGGTRAGGRGLRLCAAGAGGRGLCAVCCRC